MGSREVVVNGTDAFHILSEITVSGDRQNLNEEL